MTERACKDIEQMLVEYTDGQLSPGDSSQVAHHLAECKQCRRLLEGLGRSLELADIIWQDRLAEAEAMRVPSLRKSSRLRWAKYAAIAASILIVLGGATVWRTVISPPEKELTFTEIEHKISESASAARLLAAADLLAKYPDAQPISNQQYRYIVETYPQTPAAAEAKSRIK